LAIAAIAEPASAFSLVNGGFEAPNVASGQSNVLDANAVPGWDTTDTYNPSSYPNGPIEIWNGTQPQVNGGPVAYEGSQYAEINAYQDAALYQQVTGISAGSLIGYEFAHRARVGTDVMRLTITDLGINGYFGGGDDTVLYTNTYTDTTAAWGFYSAGNVASALGNTIRFSYGAVSTGSGDPSIGNFLDAAAFGVGVGTVPVPGPLPILGVGVGFGFCRRLRRRIQSASTAF